MWVVPAYTYLCGLPHLTCLSVGYPGQHVSMYVLSQPTHLYVGCSSTVSVGFPSQYICVGCPRLHISLWAIPPNTSLCGLFQPTHISVGFPSQHTYICWLFHLTCLSAYSVPADASLRRLSQSTHLCRLSQQTPVCMSCPSKHLCVGWLDKCCWVWVWLSYQLVS